MVTYPLILYNTMKSESERGSFSVAQMVKNLHDNAGDVGSISRSGRSPGEGNSYPQ